MQHNKNSRPNQEVNNAHNHYTFRRTGNQSSYDAFFSSFHQQSNFYNPNYSYPFMQPSYYQYSVPTYNSSYLLGAETTTDILIPQCLSSLDSLNVVEKKTKTIQSEDECLLMKVEPFQIESVQRSSQIEYKELNRMICKETPVKLKVKPFGYEKIIKYKEFIRDKSFMRSYTIPEQRNLYILLEAITVVFINEAYSIESKEKLVLSFKEKFEEVPSKYVCFLLDILELKFKSFKKTKEELIKYIIRKIYHNLREREDFKRRPEYVRLEEFHIKNLANHKAMNTEFLKKQFSNPLFLVLYRTFLNEIDEIIQNDNEKRIKRFDEALVNSWMKVDLLQIYHLKNTPWIQSCKVKTKSICQGLLLQYEKYAHKNEILKQDDDRKSDF